MRALLLAALLLIPFTAEAKTIRHDMGGVVIDYAIRVKKTDQVRFDGPCVSACTLYLTVKDKCVTPRAVFGFHAATHPSATLFLLRQYPAWVNRWIASKGGLTSRMIYMPYSYASKFIRGC